MSDVKRYTLMATDLYAAEAGEYVSYKDWATERQAREKAEAELDAMRQKVRELVEALEDSAKAWRLLEKRKYMDGGRIPSDLIPSFCGNQAGLDEAILARHKEA